MNMDAVTVQNDCLGLGPVTVSFKRTLRIPESGVHPLPPSLGNFPLRRVEDYPDTVPTEWLTHGGVMLPVYQREAMWLSFESAEPAALQVAVGKVCAVSGDRWDESLRHDNQNYVPVPEQKWLDGINSGDGVVRQFVAVPLGSGATVEGQVTGQEVHGGIQLRAAGASAELLAAREAERRAAEEARRARARKLFGPESLSDIPGVTLDFSTAPMSSLPPDAAGLPRSAAPMGLGAGGAMCQEIYEDTRKLKDYDPDRSWRAFVHLCSADQWTAITGEEAPSTPVDRDAYVRHGLP